MRKYSTKLCICGTLFLILYLMFYVHDKENVIVNKNICHCNNSNIKLLPHSDLEIYELNRNNDSSSKVYNPVENEVTKLTRTTTWSSENFKLTTESINKNKYYRNLFTNLSTVYNCLTGNIIGVWKQPEKLISNIKLIKSNVRRETAKERASSFRQVYLSSAWGTNWDDDKASSKFIGKSGRGATLHWVQEITAALHVIINNAKKDLNKKILSILDVPCGDMVWMSRFLSTRDDIDYTGIDIVPELINHHNKMYASTSKTFLVGDIVEMPLNKTYDIIICRTLLQHLYFVDALRVLRKFSLSGSSYLVITTFSANDENEEMDVIYSSNPGRFRALNLEIPPISLIPPLCLTRDGPPETNESWQQYFALWRLPLLQVSDCRMGWQLQLSAIKYPLYSCTKWDNV